MRGALSFDRQQGVLPSLPKSCGIQDVFQMYPANDESEDFGATAEQPENSWWEASEVQEHAPAATEGSYDADMNFDGSSMHYHDQYAVHGMAPPTAKSMEVAPPSAKSAHTRLTPWKFGNHHRSMSTGKIGGIRPPAHNARPARPLSSAAELRQTGYKALIQASSTTSWAHQKMFSTTARPPPKKTAFTLGRSLATKTLQSWNSHTPRIIRPPMQSPLSRFAASRPADSSELAALPDRTIRIRNLPSSWTARAAVPSLGPRIRHLLESFGELEGLPVVSGTGTSDSPDSPVILGAAVRFKSRPSAEAAVAALDGLDNRENLEKFGSLKLSADRSTVPAEHRLWVRLASDASSTQAVTILPPRIVYPCESFSQDSQQKEVTVGTSPAGEAATAPQSTATAPQVTPASAPASSSLPDGTVGAAACTSPDSVAVEGAGPEAAASEAAGLETTTTETPAPEAPASEASAEAAAAPTKAASSSPASIAAAAAAAAVAAKVASATSPSATPAPAGAQEPVLDTLAIEDAPADWTCREVEDLCAQYGFLREVAQVDSGLFNVRFATAGAAEKASNTLRGLQVKGKGGGASTLSCRRITAQESREMLANAKLAAAEQPSSKDSTKPAEDSAAVKAVAKKGAGRGNGEAQDGAPACILLRGFPASWTEKEVRLIFALFGGIDTVNFLGSPDNRIAHVKLRVVEDTAKVAKKLHNSEVGDGEMIAKCTISCELLDARSNGNNPPRQSSGPPTQRQYEGAEAKSKACPRSRSRKRRKQNDGLKAPPGIFHQVPPGVPGVPGVPPQVWPGAPHGFYGMGGPFWQGHGGPPGVFQFPFGHQQFPQGAQDPNGLAAKEDAKMKKELARGIDLCKEGRAAASAGDLETAYRRYSRGLRHLQQLDKAHPRVIAAQKKIAKYADEADQIQQDMRTTPSSAVPQAQADQEPSAPAASSRSPRRQSGAPPEDGGQARWQDQRDRGDRGDRGERGRHTGRRDHGPSTRAHPPSTGADGHGGSGRRRGQRRRSRSRRGPRRPVDASGSECDGEEPDQRRVFLAPRR